MVEDWKMHVNAIIMAYYPGMEGGTALAEIILGKINPSGKLPYVVPKQENHLPQINWRCNEQVYEYYHGYAKLEKEKKEPSMPFGFGLSYTTFQICNKKFWIDEDCICGSCEVTNTGDCVGEEVIQLYIGFTHSKVDRPIKLLRGFERVLLQENETKTVRIACPIEEIKWYNPITSKMELEHMEYEIYIGTSSNSKDLLQGTIVL